MRKKNLFFVITIVICALCCLLAGCAKKNTKQLQYYDPTPENDHADKEILFLGDSIAEGILGPSPVIARELYTYGNVVGTINGFTYRNRAVSGHKSGQCLEFISQEKDDNAFARHQTFHVQITLRSAGREYAGRTHAGDGDRAACAFTAAHGQHDRFRFDAFIAGRTVDEDLLVGRDLDDHGIKLDLDRSVLHHLDITVCIFGAGELLLEAVQTESVVDALVENTAEFFVAL